MSDKCNGLVWDMPCPARHNGIDFKPPHKYTLLAYSDHADHWGKNIYPAVKSIANKTGQDERTVQRITRDLEVMGILLSDGMGPRGTNRWKLAFNQRGDKLSPKGGILPGEGDIPSGDIPSGDIPSGDKMTPESINKDIYINFEKMFISCDWWKKFEKEIQGTKFVLDDSVLIVSGLGNRAEILTDRYSKTINRSMIGSEYDQIVFAE
jgi:hypothetical protein